MPDGSRSMAEIDSRSLVACNFPYPPSYLVRPIDEIKMVHILQGALMCAPFGAGDAHKPVIVSLDLLDDFVGLPEC